MFCGKCTVKSDGFDPYYDWLGISPAEGPADHYALLGIHRFEHDLNIIRDAADTRMELLRRYQNGAHARDSQQLLNEVSAARICLQDQAKRQKYDQQLRRKIDINALPKIESAPALFPESQIPKGSSPLQNTSPVQPNHWLTPIDNSKPGWRMPHIPFWVYLAVIGIGSVIVMSYALYRSMSGVPE